MSATCKEPCSLTFTSIFSKQESDSWDPKDNRIFQVTKKMADTMCYMTQYLKKKGPILVINTRGHCLVLNFTGSVTCSYPFPPRTKTL